MARDERLKKVQGAGADFLETARARAEEFLRELSRAGGDTSGRAQGALDDLVEGGRKGTEQLVSVIRKEITNQLGLLGLATKEDLDALEKRLSSRASAPATSGTAGTARKTAASKTAEATKTTASKTTAVKTAAAKASPAGKAAPRRAAAKKAAQ